MAKIKKKRKYVKTGKFAKKKAKRGPYKLKNFEVSSKVLIKTTGITHYSKEEALKIWKENSRYKPEVARILSTHVKTLKVGEMVFIEKSAWPYKSEPRTIAASTYKDMTFRGLKSPKGQYVMRTK